MIKSVLKCLIVASYSNSGDYRIFPPRVNIIITTIVSLSAIFLNRFCQLGNLSGIPGITLPVGYDERGLPISLQVMSAWWQEHVMIRVAMATEVYITKRRPQCYFPLL